MAKAEAGGEAVSHEGPVVRSPGPSRLWVLCTPIPNPTLALTSEVRVATSLLLALVLIQGPTSAAPVDDGLLAQPSNPVPVLARGIQVQSDRAPAASAGPASVAPAPCVYYTYIAGAAYCSLRGVRNGTLTGDARQDYLLWQVQHDIAKEMEIRVRAASASRPPRILNA